MIDVCMTGAKVTVSRFQQFLHSPVGSFLYSIVTGSIGNMVLLMFLSTILGVTSLVMVLPFIALFNAAISSYSLLDRCHYFTYPKSGVLSVSTVIALSACLSILFFCPWESLFELKRYSLVFSLSLIGGVIGGWLATKKKQINEKRN
jgi:hypothetical protein